MIDTKRKWVPICWFCTDCSYIYQIASDTLIYKMGEAINQSSLSTHCPKCEKKLVRAYRHKNPKYGKQQWLSIGWYCDRCRYAWVEVPVEH